MSVNRVHDEAVKGPEGPGVRSHTPVPGTSCIARASVVREDQASCGWAFVAPHRLSATFRPLLVDASSQSRAVQGVEALTP